jgi:DNA-binding MarR family transcriptional regulator
MSVLFRLLDAMRSDRPQSERLVWMCLENRVAGAGACSTTIEELCGELHLNKSTVSTALQALERDGIIRAERRKRCKTVFQMGDRA